ncbi:MAG: hypothetical protein M0R03_11015 [Novosphingobium sp.]|nr:hypothetical protein [Novosphingobium sp.]
MSPKIKLEKYKNTNLILAPDFCPYQIIDYEDGEVVRLANPTFCLLCKKCHFYTDDGIEENITKEEKEKLIKYFTEFNSKLSASISGQYLFLSKEGRLPLAIFINIAILDQALQYVYDNNKEKINKIKNFIISHETPIFYIMGCPVYLSSKLTKSSVMVVGEVAWN